MSFQVILGLAYAGALITHNFAASCILGIPWAILVFWNIFKWSATR